MTSVLDTSPASIARAGACLRAGGLVAFPTETVYGLGAHALDPAAVRRLFEAKGRPAEDPLIVHVASFEDVEELLGTDLETGPYSRTRRLAARFWPGPLTMVLPKSRRVPDAVTAGLDTVAVRVPAHPVARALLEAAAVPIAAPSANRFSRPSPTSAAHVLQDLEGRIDFVIDGGPTDVGIESTVLDLTAPHPTVLRPGAVTLEMLREILPTVRIAGTDDVPRADGGRAGLTVSGRADLQAGLAGNVGARRSPGQMAKHYAPRAPLTLFSGDPEGALDALVGQARLDVAEGRRVGVIVPGAEAGRFAGLPVTIAESGAPGDPAAMAARLYAALRELDAAGVEVILVRDADGDEGLGRAIRDRLRRAASAHVTVEPHS